MIENKRSCRCGSGSFFLFIGISSRQSAKKPDNRPASRVSRKSNGLFDTLFFIWGIISFKIKIDLKRSENPTSVTDEAILNPLQKNRGFLDSLKAGQSSGFLALHR
jgi:hypothetical protein